MVFRVGPLNRLDMLLLMTAEVLQDRRNGLLEQHGCLGSIVSMYRVPAILLSSAEPACSCRLTTTTPFSLCLNGTLGAAKCQCLAFAFCPSLSVCWFSPVAIPSALCLTT